MNALKDWITEHWNTLCQGLDNTTVPGLQGISWFKLLKIYFSGLINGAITTRAAAIAYGFILASLPFLLFLLFLVQLVPFDMQSEIDFYLQETLPPNTLEVVNGALQHLQTSQAKSSVFSIGFLVTWVVMSGGVRAIFTGFSTSSYEFERRSLPKQYFIALLVSLILAALMVLNFSVAIILGIVLEYFDVIAHYLYEIFGFYLSLSNYESFFISMGRYIAMGLITLVSISVLYFFGMPKTERFNRFFSPGAYLTTVLIILGSYVFALYIQYVASYNALYGSIGSLLIIVVWVWFMMILILLGFELNLSIINLRRREERQKHQQEQATAKPKTELKAELKAELKEPANELKDLKKSPEIE